MVSVIVSYTSVRNGRIANERAVSAIVAVSDLVSSARHVED